MELSRKQWGSVSLAAVRVGRFAARVAEAHCLGHGPGKSRKPWEIGFQRRACLIYAPTLRPEYLRGVADASAYCAGLMDGAEPESRIAADWDTADWEIVARFLRSTSRALGEMPEVAAVASGAVGAEIESAPPAALRYELFAELLNPQGVARLRDAAEAVARCCASHMQTAPTAQELELIASLAVQEPVGELAERNAVSLRAMYRRIEKMWKRLGAANQVQGVALAVQQGWIAPPPWGEEQT